MTEHETLDALVGALRALGVEPRIYDDPTKLEKSAALHKNELIWPLYSGQSSRNRLALVPAICEAHRLPFIGPDAYGQIVCQDKEISKHIARTCGLATARHRLLREPSDVTRLAQFPTPYVLKPVREGTSIGISQRNLIWHSEEGGALASELLREFGQPIMVEEFVGGKEVSYNYIVADPDCHWNFSEIHVDGQESYFDSHLFDAEEKVHRSLPRHVRVIDEMLSTDDRNRIDDLIRAIGTIVYCRIDGKLHNGRFIYLEATPDAHIAPEAAFSASFIIKGWTYTDVISAILRAATQALRGR